MKSTNQPLEKLLLTRLELSNHGYPSRKDIAEGDFQYLPMPGEITPPDKTLNIIALSCDLCKTNMGFLTVSKITVVDQHLKVVMSDLIRPEYPIVDYCTEISGVTEEDMQGVTLTKKEGLKKLFKLIDKNTIIVGYNLELDLRSLRIVHTRCVDVVVLFQCFSELGLDTSISSLMQLLLTPEEKRCANAIKSMQLALVLFAALAWRENYENHENNPLFHTCQVQPAISHHGWRSKQELIEQVHQQLMWKYRERVIRPPTPILIGKEVVRIHVKKWQQLCNIEHALEELERPSDPDKMEYAPGLGIRFSLLSLPISMKTKSQKKGFFVYLKVPSNKDALRVIKYLKGSRWGKHPYKVELAVPRDEANEEFEQDFEMKTNNQFQRSSQSPKETIVSDQDQVFLSDQQDSQARIQIAPIGSENSRSSPEKKAPGACFPLYDPQNAPYMVNTQSSQI